MKNLKIIFALVLICCSFVNTQAQNSKPKVQIDHMAIFVADLQKEAAFYRDIIQLDTIPEPFHDKKHAWFSIGNGIALHIIQGAQQPKEYFKNHHLCLSVESLVDFTNRLISQRLPFEDVNGKQNSVTNRIDGVNQIWLKDPEGYWLEINDAKH